MGRDDDDADAREKLLGNIPTVQAEAAPPPPQRLKRREALDCARYVASCQIVAFHWYVCAGGMMPAVMALPAHGHHRAKRNWQIVYNIFAWGTTWTQFFFVMSGFVLCLARLQSRNPTETKPPLRFALERLVGCYPAYLFAVCLAMASSTNSFATLPTSAWVNLLRIVLLVQAWWNVELSGWVALRPLWFMAALMFYWLLFGPLYQALRRLPVPALWPCFLACWLLSFAPWVDQLANGYDEYRDVFSRSTDPDHDSLNLKQMPLSHHAFWRYHPFAYLHVFVGGMVLARILYEAEGIQSSSRPLWFVVASNHGAKLGYGIYALIVGRFVYFGRTPTTYQGETGAFLFWHNGGLLPIYALMLFGLATEKDVWISRLFKTSAGKFLGRISYCQYLTQLMVISTVPVAYYSLDKTVVKHTVVDGETVAYNKTEHYHKWQWQLVLPLSVFFVSCFATFLVHEPGMLYFRKKLAEVDAAVAKDVAPFLAEKFGMTRVDEYFNPSPTSPANTNYGAVEDPPVAKTASRQQS